MPDTRANAPNASARADASSATTPNREDFTRTVGFSVPSAIARADDGRDSPRSGMAAELRAMRGLPGGDRALGAGEGRAQVGEMDGEAAREGAGFAAGDAKVGSRSPVMILPTNARSGGQRTTPMKPVDAVAVDAKDLAKEFAQKAATGERSESLTTDAVAGLDAKAAAPEMVEKVAQEVAHQSASEVEAVKAVPKEKVAAPESGAQEQQEKKEKKEKKEKAAGPPREIPEKKPPMTKAERRALQESQRAAKAAAKAESGVAAPKKPGGEAAPPSSTDVAPASVSKGTEEKAVSGSKKTPSATQRSITGLKSGVSHLRGVTKLYVPTEKAHAAVERLALNYSRGNNKGARQRLSSLLQVLRIVIESYEVPADSQYAVSLTHTINQVVHTLDKARPMGVAMGNAVRSLKTHLARLSREESQGMCSDRCKQQTLMHIDYFIKEKIEGALVSIVNTGAEKIETGDVIVTHGASHAVREILLKAHKSGVKFTVVIVDSRPSSEGAGILSELGSHGIECVFTALNGLSYVMQKATKVLIGAAACLSNGAVVSRIGSSAVAHAAVQRSVPVFVAAETCKFHERVQFDAFAFNELGGDEEVINVRGVESVLASATGQNNLAIINLRYDIIPSKCVRSIICEAGEISPSEVPCYTLGPH